MKNNINIPESIISQFVEISSKNFSIDGGHIETLAFLIGYENDSDIIATELIIPKQHGTPTNVDDLGINFFKEYCCS